VGSLEQNTSEVRVVFHNEKHEVLFGEVLAVIFDRGRDVGRCVFSVGGRRPARFFLLRGGFGIRSALDLLHVRFGTEGRHRFGERLLATFLVAVALAALFDDDLVVDGRKEERERRPFPGHALQMQFASQ